MGAIFPFFKGYSRIKGTFNGRCVHAPETASSQWFGSKPPHRTTTRLICAM